MPSERMEEILAAHLSELESTGRAKGAETVFCGVVAPEGGKGPRYLLAGEGERRYLRMNSNSYLGMSLNSEVQGAEEAAVHTLGAGPGAVRFISGTWSAHTALEQRLAKFHGRQSAMIFSSAYATVMGVLPQLIDGETVVISDALNHNCIINAIRLARPKEKRVYAHLDFAELDRILSECSETCRRALVITDGIFSMRGDHAPLDEIMALAEKYDFLIFADECYSEIYRDTPPTGALEVVKELGTDRNRVVIFHSLSKRSNLPGLRSGFAASGPETMREIKQLRNYAGAPLPLPLQQAAAAVWADEAHVEENRALYQEKYAIADRIFGNVPGYASPEAGFFLWLPVEDDEAAALKLWRETGVRVLPGSYLAQNVAGENPGQNYIRVALVAPKDETTRGLEAIRDCLYST